MFARLELLIKGYNENINDFTENFINKKLFSARVITENALKDFGASYIKNMRLKYTI